jgi:hypothetical protein
MTERIKSIISTALIAIGLIFIIVGISRGEAEVVFQKAINICLECIGIG